MSSDYPWFAHYPDNVPHEIDPDQYDSLVEVIEEAFQTYPSHPAFRNFGVTLTYADIDRLSYQFAVFLRRELKLEKGDRIAIMLPNVLQYPIVLFAAMRAGLIVSNTNPMYTAHELKHQLNDSGAIAIVVLENFAHTLANIMADTPVKHVVTTRIGDMLGHVKGALFNFVLKHIKKQVPAFDLPASISFKTALKKGSQGSLPDVSIHREDVVFLQYTGGTTGVAKGAMLTHRNMIANMLQADAWIAGSTTPGKEIIITALPLYHIFSLTANALIFLRLGGLNLLITNPRDMHHFVKDIKHVDFTALTGVNTLFNGLLNTEGFQDVDFSRLHLSLGGGMAVQKAVAKRWKEVTGCVLAEAYGLTETSPAVCINPLDITDYNSSIGLPIPSTEVAIWSDEKDILGPNQEGELMVRGPQVMKGYWQRQDETAQVLEQDGWLHTGDMAKIDNNGYVYIVDRKKDMILVSGFNVYPNEIEDVLMQHPKVREVAAVGIPDAHSGEAVKLFIVKKDASLEKNEVIEFCNQHLTGYKHPRAVEFRDNLPKSNVGKILRRKLRE